MPVLKRNPDGPYYSEGDERAFFEWVMRIPRVSKVCGSGPELHIHVRGRAIPAVALREFIALFHRYDGPMSQLAQFQNSSNRNWFRDPSAYWYRSVFGHGTRSNKALQPASRAQGTTRPSRRIRAARS
jgi:hypothetical protein